MATFMYQAAYTADAWSNQLENPQNRVGTVGRQMCEAVGGKFCRRLAFAAGGAVKASKTTLLITGAEGIEALKRAVTAVKVYKNIDTQRSMAAPS